MPIAAHKVWTTGDHLPCSISKSEAFYVAKHQDTAHAKLNELIGSPVLIALKRPNTQCISFMDNLEP